MDKHLHRDIGEQFSEDINSLSQEPREHIWENIDKALDKTDAKNYKEKFTRLKKRTMLLLLLLIGISTYSVIYFNTSKNKSNLPEAVRNYKTAEQKTNESASNSKTGNNIKGRPQSSATNLFPLHPVLENNTPGTNLTGATGQGSFIAKKITVINKGKTNIKISMGTIAGGKNAEDDTIEIIKNNVVAKPVDAFIFNKPVTTKDAENKPASISALLKKDALPLSADNQSSKKNNKKRKAYNPKFTLTAFAAADYTAYRLENDEFNTRDNKAGIEKRERSDLSSSAGILVGYTIRKKITIQSGIMYSSSNISIDPTKIYAEKDNAGIIKYRYNTSFGYGYLLPSFNSSPSVGDSLFANGANHTLNYISIPLIAKYKVGNKKISFNPGVGVTFNFLTKATLTTDVEDQFNTETEYISKLHSIKEFGSSIILTPEVQYQLSKKINISALPYFKYSLGVINKGNVVKTYPYTFGLGIGVVYKF